MRFLFRIGVLVLAAVGVKYLVERYGKREASAGSSDGLTVLDSAKDAVREVVDHAKVAASGVADQAKTAAVEVAADARARADEVRQTVDSTNEVVASDGGSTSKH